MRLDRFLRLSSLAFLCMSFSFINQGILIINATTMTTTLYFHPNENTYCNYITKLYHRPHTTCPNPCDQNQSSSYSTSRFLYRLRGGASPSPSGPYNDKFLSSSPSWRQPQQRRIPPPPLSSSPFKRSTVLSSSSYTVQHPSDDIEDEEEGEGTLDNTPSSSYHPSTTTTLSSTKEQIQAFLTRQDRNTFIVRVYSILSLQLLFTAGVILMFTSNPPLQYWILKRGQAGNDVYIPFSFIDNTEQPIYICIYSLFYLHVFSPMFHVYLPIYSSYDICISFFYCMVYYLL